MRRSFAPAGTAEAAVSTWLFFFFFFDFYAEGFEEF
jgi:hypothetical protein